MLFYCKDKKSYWSHTLENFISDCVVRHAKNSTFGSYQFTTRYGSFSIPFFSVTCEKTNFSIEINGNHQHYNRLIEAIIEDMSNNGE